MVDSLYSRVCWESGSIVPENARGTIPALASNPQRRHAHWRSLPCEVAVFVSFVVALIWRYVYSASHGGIPAMVFRRQNVAFFDARCNIYWSVRFVL